jgi:hypothetical protein
MLLAVPTAYTVFASEIGASALWVRLGVIALWLGAAVAIVTVTRLREELSASQLDQLATDQRRRVTRSAEALIEAILGSSLRSEVPSAYELTVYRYDSAHDALVPIWPSLDPAELDLATFRSGAGATGYSWDRDTLIVAVDDAVSDASFGLTPEQQEYFNAGRAVAATPIYGPNDERLGILTAYSVENDGAFENERTREALRDLAAALGLLLADLDVSTDS